MSREALAAEQAQLAAGLAPRYRVDGRLGEGACGIVWGATRAEDGRRVAIKFLRSQMAGAAGIRTRFEREIDILGRLRHPHVMELVEAGALGDRPFLIMPRVEGSDLDAVLKAGSVAPARALKWLAQVATAVETAHSLGVIHRDLKPANVLVTDTDDALVTDFGLASGAGFEELTRTGTFVGTPLYMAPEQFMGEAPDASMDVYALASMAYRLFEGREPFQAPDLGALVAAKCIPPEDAPRTREAGGEGLEDLVLQALAEDPAERPLMVELRAQLVRRVDPTVRLPAPPQAPPPPKPASRPTQALRPAPSGTGTASGAHRPEDSVLRGSYTGPPEDRGLVMRRSLAMAAGLVLVAVGFFLPGSEPAGAPAVPAGPPPVPAFALGLDEGGLELRFAGPVGRAVVVLVETPSGDSRRVELGPDEDVADIPWAEFTPDTFTVAVEDEAGTRLAEETRTLALQRLAPPAASGGWAPFPVSRGEEAWIPRGAGGFDRLRPNRGKLEVAGAIDPTGGWGRVFRAEPIPGGGMLALAFEPERKLLLSATGPGAPAQLEVPLAGGRQARVLPLGRGRVLLVPGKEPRDGSAPVAKVLELETGVMQDVPWPEGYPGRLARAVVGKDFVFLLLSKDSLQGRLEILRRDRGRLVPHAALVGDGEVVEDGQVADEHRCQKGLGVVAARDLAVFWLGYDVLRVAAAEVPPGVHDLAAGIPPGVAVTSMGEVLSRASGDVAFAVEGEVLTAATMAPVAGTSPSLQIEEFALSRLDLAVPGSEPRDFFRHSRGTVPHVGTWAGKCRVMWDPYSGHWLATYETDRLGNNLLLVDDRGQLRYWRHTFEAERWGREDPTRLAGGVLLGEPGYGLWYVPLWTHPPAGARSVEDTP